jgi:glycerophosphoryl diester phosphodiesterase
MIRTGLLICAALALSACVSTPSSTPRTEAAAVKAPASAVWRGDLGRYFDCLRERNITIAAAHRLGGQGVLENTIEAMRATQAQATHSAPAIMELDIRQTKDGALVIMHDETVDRTTTGTGRVDAMSLAEFQSLRLEAPGPTAKPSPPPTLQELLAIDEGIVLQLDVKRGVSFEDVIAAVQTADAKNRVIVIVYSLADAITVHNLDPSLMMSVQINSEEELDTLSRVGVNLSRVLAWTGTREPRPALYQALRARGVEVLFGTLGPEGQSIDSQIEASRQPRRYVEIARTGVTQIATGRYRPTTEALLAGGDGDPYACAKTTSVTP